MVLRYQVNFYKIKMHGGVLSKGGNMRNIIVLLVTMMLLVGCQRADSQVMVLSSQDVEQELVLETDTAEETPKETETAEAIEKVTCAVFVCGAVVNPGVYYLDNDLRIVDAVDAAGGFTEDADKAYVNLAALVQDGQRLRIPTVAEVAEAEKASDKSAKAESFDIGDTSGQGTGSADSNNGLININTASIEELKVLPGIGDAVAGKIVSYRTENGNFSCIEDIMKVSGIKNKLFSKIKDQITV